MEPISERIKKLKGLSEDEDMEQNSSGYNLQADIGSGTFGQVKLATHIDTGLPVAIKVLSKQEIQQNDDFQRVAREFEILMQIDHPNIIYLYEVKSSYKIIEEEEYYFMVTEFCPDGDLENLIREKTRLSEEEAYEYLAQIISAVNYLHSKHIVHRDIKPENILLSGKRIKIIDFGLSNLYDPRARLKTPCGSPCFAPPEMVCGLEYDPTKSDIWSIGITLFYMVTGTLPFMDKELKSLYQKIVGGIVEFPEYLSENMKTLISSMLCSNPKSRASLKTLSEMPLLHSIAESSVQIRELNEEVILSSAKACNIPATLLREFIKTGNKNGFTAHYYLELKQFEGNCQELNKETSKPQPSQPKELGDRFTTPIKSERRSREAHRYTDLDSLKKTGKEEHQMFKVTIDSEFDGTMFYSKRSDLKTSRLGLNSKKGSGDRLRKKKHEKKEEDTKSAIFTSELKDPHPKKALLGSNIRKQETHKEFAKLILGRKGGVLERFSHRNKKKKSPGLSLTQRHHGVTVIPAEGLKIKTRSPSQRKYSKEHHRSERSKIMSAEIKPSGKLKSCNSGAIKSRVKFNGVKKHTRATEGSATHFQEKHLGVLQRNSRSPNVSRTRKTGEFHSKPLERIQNIFIKNSTLVNQMGPSKSPFPLPFTNLNPACFSSTNRRSPNIHKQNGKHPKSSLFNLINPRPKLELENPHSKLTSHSRSKKNCISRLQASPGSSYTEKSSKRETGGWSSRFESNKKKQGRSTQNDSEYLMTPNLEKKKSRRGQKFKLQNKVYEILKNIVKE